jgi:hypothetical protein
VQRRQFSSSTGLNQVEPKLTHNVREFELNIKKEWKNNNEELMANTDD